MLRGLDLKTNVTTNHLVTVSDSRYLPYGLSLYDSLRETTNNFKLHYFLIERKDYSKLKNLKTEHLEFYYAGDFANLPIHEDLKLNDYKYYCWSLASFLTHYVQKTVADAVTYIDSDICFHSDFKHIFNLTDNSDVILFRHRMHNLSKEYIEGWFNVGVVHFKNTPYGKEALNWWKDAVMHKKFPKYATCGDQKYLDFVYKNWKSHVCVDGDVGHGAPWHWQLYAFEKNQAEHFISWRGVRQKLIFTHFSQFHVNWDKFTYYPSTAHFNYTPIWYYHEIIPLKTIYEGYFKRLVESKRVLERIA